MHREMDMPNGRTDELVKHRLEQMTAALKQAGYRITPQRLAILEILAASEGHPSVERIFTLITKRFPTTSLATVYKTVNLLKRQGQVLELAFSDMGNRYDGKLPFAHPHVICISCGAIADPIQPDIAELQERMARETGFDIRSHRLDFYGLCPDCRKKSSK